MKKILLLFLLSVSLFANEKVKKIAEFQYPNDAKMQKFTYEKEISAKNYMKTVNDQEIKNMATSKYANDYSMQKYYYDNNNF